MAEKLDTLASAEFNRNELAQSGGSWPTKQNDNILQSPRTVDCPQCAQLQQAECVQCGRTAKQSAKPSSESVSPSVSDIRVSDSPPVYKEDKSSQDKQKEHRERHEIVDDLKDQRDAEENSDDSDSDEEEECEIDERMWDKLEKRRPPSISDLNLAERTWVRRILMLYNPHSGRQRGAKLARRSLRLFKKLDIEVEQIELQYSGHAERICATMDVKVGKPSKEGDDVDKELIEKATHVHQGSKESNDEIKTTLERSCSGDDIKTKHTGEDKDAIKADSDAHDDAAERGHQHHKRKESPRTVEHPNADAQAEAEKKKTEADQEALPWDLICAVGGDGTFHECINGIMTRKAKGQSILPLSLIAAGTGNSFMLELGLRDWKTAVYHIARGVHYPIDICELHFGDGKVSYSFNSIHWGMASRVLVRAEKLRWMGTAIRYTTAAMMEILQGKITLARVSARDAQDRLVEFDQPFACAIANNIITASRGMKMAPDAKLDDGLIDLLLITSNSSMNLMTMFRKTYDGTHTDLPFVHYMQVKSFSITPYKLPPIEQEMAERKDKHEHTNTLTDVSSQGGSSAENLGVAEEDVEEIEELLDVDGELKGCTPLSCVVLPRSLRVIL